MCISFVYTKIKFLFGQQCHLLLYFKVLKICKYFHTGYMAKLTYVILFIKFMIYDICNIIHKIYDL